MKDVASKSPAEPKLASASFVGLLVTQFLGSMNDNMFRWLAVPIAKETFGAAASLSLGAICFTLPYLLLASHAGYLADRYSKRTVIVWCKVAEIVLMIFGVMAIYFGNVYLMFLCVSLMGAQSALFSPAKYGIIPEMLPGRLLSKGNGWMGMVTVVSAAVGTVGGNWLYSLNTPSLNEPGDWRSLAPIALAVVGVAIVGTISSLFIQRSAAADLKRAFPINPFVETVHQLRLLGGNIKLMRAALGIGFFWMLASLANLNIDTYVTGQLHLGQMEVGILMAVLVAGVASGSLLAGWLSGGKVELGLVPFGAIGIAVSSLLLFLTGDGVNPLIQDSSRQAYIWSCVWLLGLGMSAGFFDIPLEAYLQDRSPEQSRGSILAASNFITFALIVISSGLFYVLNGVLELSASSIFLIAGLGTIPVIIYVFALLPDATVRFFVWMLSITFYRVRVTGKENIPERGGALLVANHVSWLDGIFLLLVSSRPIRMIAHGPYLQTWGVRWLADKFGVIPINATGGPKAILKSLQTAREALERGELVCIFAEGQITRTGQLLPFQRGIMRIIDGTDAPVVPVYLDELWGSAYSYSGGRFFWKRPKRWPYPVSITFGKPLTDPDDVNVVREAVQNLGVQSVENRKDRDLIPPRQFLRNMRKNRKSLKVVDSTGAQLTAGRLLIGALAFRRMLMREVIKPNEGMVGILLPPTAAGVVSNLAITLMNRVAVNLNYTLSNDDVNYCVDQCQIKHVLTSKLFMMQRPYTLKNAELVYLEELKEKVTKMDKAIAAMQALVLPVSVLERHLGLTKVKPDDLMTVIFTSGSTGEPKGVMLSYHNVGSNAEGADSLYHFRSDDVVLGILPFFHSFGYTLTLWLAMTHEPRMVYHVNPAEAKQIGRLCQKNNVTFIAATPTFLRTYLKRCSPQQFAKLDTVILGAEKMPLDLADAWEEKFGFRPNEGYGTTELSPLVSANVPDRRLRSGEQTAWKEGSVGRPIPGVTGKIIDADTGEKLGVNEEGLLWIKGPNVMLGYLNKPEKTAEVLKDGWYNTGDIGFIDDEGFIHITGRQSRFSKIGGEMVPHIKIEEIIAKFVEDPNDEEGLLNVAVTSVPDEKKGERLVVLHRQLKKTPEEILNALTEANVPNLWLPDKREGFIEVDGIPVLGTGKLDLRSLKQVALERCGSVSVAE